MHANANTALASLPSPGTIQAALQVKKTSDNSDPATEATARRTYAPDVRRIVAKGRGDDVLPQVLASADPRPMFDVEYSNCQVAMTSSTAQN